VSDLFQLTFTPPAEVLAEKNRSLKMRVLGEMKSAMTIQMGILQRHVKQDKLSGQMLKNRTGNLRNAIFLKVEQTNDAVTGTVGLDPNGPAWYGILHHSGGVFHARGHVARASFGRPTGVGELRGRPYDIHFQARPFMTSALADRKAAIVAALELAVKRGVEQ